VAQRRKRTPGSRWDRFFTSSDSYPLPHALPTIT
jgi:hypothetical protein